MSTTDLPGPTLLAGRYRLVERLGAGGMSVVWRGFDEVLGRQVAVKVLPPSVSADPSFRRRLRAEAQAAARLSHPHITNVYDYGEASTSGGDLVPFVVMELVDGESLAGVLGRLHQLPWHVAVRICAQASAALAAAHARGIVHRDVTPANVMLTSSGVKVVDFGISALIGENDADPDGSLLGTPAYLAPERLSGGQVSPASDVYAVGLLIYRALIGQLPWDVGTTTALLRAHQYTQPGPLPPVEGMPPAVNALVGRCLEKQPADRPSSAELSAVLAQISAGGPAVTESWAGYGQDTTILPAPDEYPDPARRDAPVPAAPVPFDASAARPPVPVPFGAVRGAAPAGPASTGCDPVAASRLAAVSVSAGSATAAPGAGPAPPQPSAGTPLAGRPGPAVAAGIVAPRNSRFGPAPPAAAAAPSGDGRPTPPGSAQPTVADAAAQPGQWATTPAPVVRIRPPAGAAPVRGQDHQSFGPARGAAASPGDQPGRAHPAAAAPIGPPSGRPASGAGVSSGHARRLSVVLALVAAVGAVGYGWSGWTGAADGSRQQAAPEQLLPAQPRRCVVTYAIRSRSGKTFAAALMLTNRAPSSVTDWQLRFVLPGDQQVRATGTVNLEQEGRDVTVRSAGAIEPHRTVVVNLAGSYQQNNDVPVDFELDDVTCDVYVSSAPGAPPLQVQTSPEGRVTLAAPPPGTPVPGLSSRPDGAFVPVATDEPRGATGRPSRNAPGDAPTSVPSSNSTTGTASATTTAPLPPSPPSVITSGPTATTSTSGTAPAATTAPNTTAPATTAPTKRPPPPIFTRPTTESPSS